MKERLYAALPSLLQDVAVSVEGWRVRRDRYGGDFHDRLHGYLARERASDDEVLGVRRRRLRRLLEHATREIPYWSALFARVGLDPARVQGPEDLSVLPILTKAEVLRQGAALHWRGAPERAVRRVHTSGTTGAGMIFPTTLDAIRDQWAVWWRFRMRQGIALDTWSGTFGGRTIVPPGRRTRRLWRVNRPGRQILYSQYHLSAATAGLYLGHMERARLPWLHGYPSVLALLAALGLEQGATARVRPRVVTLGAENVLASQGRAIAQAFGVTPVQHYGMAEAVANASQCPAGRFHVDEDFAAVELLPDGPDTVRVLGTGLENLAMPLIRYDTGDLARVAAEGCACGLPGRVLASIDGRQEDFVVLADGSRVGRLDHLFKDMEQVAEAQIRQREPGRCTIAVVPRAGWGPGEERRLLAECQARFGDRLEVSVETVDEIPRTRSGKLRMVVSEVGRLS